MNARARNRTIAAVLVCAAAISMSGCGKNNNDNGGTNNGAANNGANSGSNAGGEQTITVKATNFKFDQPEIHVKQGDKVTIKLVDEAGMHGFALPDYKVDIKENNGTASFTADKAGEYPYNCSIVCGSGHTSMVGKLVVE